MGGINNFKKHLLSFDGQWKGMHNLRNCETCEVSQVTTCGELEELVSTQHLHNPGFNTRAVR